MLYYSTHQSIQGFLFEALLKCIYYTVESRSLVFHLFMMLVGKSSSPIEWQRIAIR